MDDKDRKDYKDKEEDSKDVSYLAIGIALGAGVGVAIKNISKVLENITWSKEEDIRCTKD